MAFKGEGRENASAECMQRAKKMRAYQINFLMSGQTWNELGHQPSTGDDLIDRESPVYLELEEEWKSENAGRNIAIIVGSVIGIILFIIVAAGVVYRVVQVRRAKHTLPSDDGEGNATYDRFEDNCHCNS